ncbi:MAG TPA: DUF6510 family protein [Actinomycetes bacterium]
MTTNFPSGLDGNAAAGDLSAVFAVDVTAALAQCAGCGRSGALAETALYLHGPGLVLRCRGCDAVLVRLVNSADRRWLDLRGVAVLQLERAAAD